MEDFFDKYAETEQIVMMLQSEVVFEEYFRCYCLGGKYVHIMPYEPRNPHHLRYAVETKSSPEMLALVHDYVLKLNHALGYDFNTVEFGVQDGVPYAIDFCNPAPDADIASVGKENFDWIVENAANFAIERALAHKDGQMNLTWGTFVKNAAQGLAADTGYNHAVKTTSTTATKTAAAPKAEVKAAAKPAATKTVETKAAAKPAATKAVETKVAAPKAEVKVAAKPVSAKTVETKVTAPKAEVKTAAKPVAAKTVETKAAAPKAEVKAVAKAAAPKKAASTKDDLKIVEGIGPKIEELLNAAGINSFADLSNSNAAALKTILAGGGKRYAIHNPSTWVQQGFLAASGKMDELKAWQAELNGGKK
jgi:predicted flap endonuclease-1-like 5' DNA nuclease